MRHVLPPGDPEESPQSAVSCSVVVWREDNPHVWVCPPRGRGGPHREDRVCAVDVHRVGVVEKPLEETPQLAYLPLICGRRRWVPRWATGLRIRRLSPPHAASLPQAPATTMTSCPILANLSATDFTTYSTPPIRG
jgi:hypothetical protein